MKRVIVGSGGRDGDGVVARGESGERRCCVAAVHLSFCYFCAFSGPNFTGDTRDWVACGINDPIPWSGVGSWINNQTG